jgi:putative hydrolase of the HAD superfamily
MYFDSILFDLDDTLHNRNKSLDKFANLFEQKYNQLIKYKKNIKALLFEIDQRGYKPREEMFKEIQNRISWVVKPDIQEFIDFWNVEFPKCAEPMDNLYSTLNYLYLDNIKMGIVTNGESLFQHTKINRLCLNKYMKTIIISDEVGIRKPDKDIFLLALSKLESKGESTLFVGDNPTTDIKGAIDAGLVTVWLSGGEKWSNCDYMPQYTISDIAELKTFFTINIGLEK